MSGHNVLAHCVHACTQTHAYKLEFKVSGSVLWSDINLFHAVSAEEVERLEQDLEARQGEVESLREEQAIALQDLEQQGVLNQSLKQQCQEQKQGQAKLERELETKNQLVGQIVN